MKWTLPNILTVLRLLLLPLLICCFYLEADLGATAIWCGFAIYTIAAITDFLDGWAARKLNQISAFGTFLDPISDKIFVSTLLILLVAFDRLEGLWLLPVIIIFFREFLISGLREFLGPHDVKMPVTKMAKWKTTLQMVALGLLILGPLDLAILAFGQWCLLFAAGLTVITGWGYLKAGMDVIRKLD